MTGGPDDGAGLYPEGQEPCLVCGWLVNVDWDGLTVWHYQRPAPQMLKWCPGSRSSWQVPA